SDAFATSDLHKAGYKANPLEDGSLKGYRVFRIPINTLNRAAVSEMKLRPTEADRCKNFFALGLVYWLYDRSMDPTLRWIRDKFAKNPAVMEANTRTLKAGYNFGETTETMPVHFHVPPASIKPGTYRKITGNEALAIGLAVVTELPVIVIDVQRGGPSAGLPTKTEQADLLQAMFGRNGECPVAIVAPCSPADCFTMVFEAVRLAVGFMTPVLLLSDGYLANGAEPWLIPKVSDLARITITHPTRPNSNGNG